MAAVQRELEHTQRLTTIGTLAAGVAHEVNNLLTPALAYAQLAQNRPNDEDLQRKALDKAVCGIEATSLILRTVLGFSRADGETGAAAVAEVLQSAVDCLGRSITGGRVALIQEIEPSLEVAIGSLPLQQTLLNLLLNSCRALGQQGGQIAVSAGADDDGMATISVADNGPGIPAEIVERIFEPFVSHDTETPASGAPQSGAGLGLAVCRRAVEAAGGSIRADTTPGGGATFIVRLPLTHG
ncbi:MAG: HAMP domain-containing histidine kinase [Planctomycetes bacterium]|nr:HAMP domain-containing histidine kinase [Planctomycetota bacterium]